MLKKSNSAEGKSLSGTHDDAKLAESSKRVGHQTLAAGFADRRLRSIGEHYIETAPSCGNCGGQSGRTTPNYEDVCLLPHACSLSGHSRTGHQNACVIWRSKYLGLFLPALAHPSRTTLNCASVPRPRGWQRQTHRFRLPLPQEAAPLSAP